MNVAEKMQAAFEHHRAGRFAEARATYDEVLQIAPDHADAWHYSGLAAFQGGDVDIALERLQHAVAVEPGRPRIYSDLGAALRLKGHLEDAREALERAVTADPGHTQAWHNLGMTHRARGDLARASECLERAVSLDPTLAVSHNALGTIRRMNSDLAGALSAFREAVQANPQFAEALSNLGLALHENGRSGEAEQMLKRALAAAPNLAAAHFNLATVYQGEGAFDAARDALRRTVALESKHGEARSALLFTHHYDPAMSGETILEQARAWNRLIADPLRTKRGVLTNDRDPERRLRVGYVSPDFRIHSCAFFLLPLLATHDRNAVEVFAYADVKKPDAMTETLRGYVDHWCPSRELDHDALAQRIRVDGIDILVDLQGHLSDNRLPVFAMKPAPVQVSWLGYPGTTGLPAIDYRITDASADPPGVADTQFSETLVRLPGPFLCWGPPVDSPEPALRARGDGDAIVFGSFNNVAKLTPQVVTLWARILDAVPNSELVLKSYWLGRRRVVERIQSLFEAQGVPRARVKCLSWIEAIGGHLDAYDGIDIALDPFPYNGTTTTLEALWMGVPVVALSGSRHSGRVGASILFHAGAAELLAETTDDYADKAIALAQDRPRRAAYRHDLRAALLSSPLLDGAGFARAIETAYRTMWRDWCAR
jgi:protein O-GlcNAc transferase